ncbi:hypothetical protein GM658_27120 [Pseudoduganella eburnea]|uniref:DUF2490 domain-containing protein n=1 Tax=Massilia eburnea TaxID=1776165 RepID=A0A6L6QS54_9BURK|nr:TorF family putative porin [Massilia eburnea]MTW14293.1 hypothetical protein [Massilia eburnea]
MRPDHDPENQRRSLSRPRPAGWLPGLACMLAMPAAFAQLSGSAAVLSDYRFRGLSLNDDRPTPQLTLNYDRDDGWYAGAMASHAKLGENSTAQLVAYGGYARRLPGGIGWEAGATQTIFTQASADNYFEAYAGISGEQVSARLYFSPRYFGRPARTVYAEANGFLRLGQTLRLVGHAGLLRALGGEDSIAPLSGHRYDFRLGLAVQVGDVDVQLARVTRAAYRYPSYHGYPPYAGPQPHAFVLSAAYSF